MTAAEGWRTERSLAPAGLCRQESQAYLAALPENGKRKKEKKAIKPNEGILNPVSLQARLDEALFFFFKRGLLGFVYIFETIDRLFKRELQ